MGRGKANERLAKRLVRQLRNCQDEDKPLPEPWLFSIRYLLPWLRWGSMPIDVEQNALEPSHLDVSRDAIPEFFHSQVEPKRLMPRCLPRVPTSPLLEFVLSIVPKNSKNGIPLLFRSLSRVRNRHHHIFVFGAFKIMPRDGFPYSVQELLALRDREAPTNLRPILAGDPDLGKSQVCRAP